MKTSGWPPELLKKVPLYVSVFSTGHNRLLRIPMMFVKKIVFGIVRRLGKGMPTIAGAETWAFKNTMLAVQVTVVCAYSVVFMACSLLWCGLTYGAILQYLRDCFASFVVRPALENGRFSPAGLGTMLRHVRLWV